MAFCCCCIHVPVLITFQILRGFIEPAANQNSMVGVKFCKGLQGLQKHKFSSIALLYFFLFFQNLLVPGISCSLKVDFLEIQSSTLQTLVSPSPSSADMKRDAARSPRSVCRQSRSEKKNKEKEKCAILYSH